MPDDSKPVARRLTPERIAELRAAGDAAEDELRRVRAVCAHPGDRRRMLGWGTICDVCKARLA